MKRAIFSVAAALVLTVIIAFPVLALAAPSSMSISSIKVVRNVVETGDVCMVFQYNIVYSSYPTTPASNTIIFRLYDTDGVTLKKSAVPYVWVNYGYGVGVSSFYFPASENLTWGAAYTLNIAGSPAYFDPLPTAYNYPLAASDYSSVTTQQDNQDVMELYILDLCDVLHANYPSIEFKGSTDVGLVLTDYGESYLRGAVPGLASIAPGVFFTQYYVPDPELPTYTNAMSTNYTARLAGSDIMDGLDNFGTFIGLGASSGPVVGTFLALLACLAFAILAVWIGWGIEPGLMADSNGLTAVALLIGDASWTLTLFIAFIAGILLFYTLFLRRA